jgi:hypothetical protein
MREIATEAHYQELAQIHEDLLAAGVVRIHLDALDWGPVTVDGSTATATVDETWTSEFADGTTDQSRDRNLYRLVQQNGAWTIQSNEHPDNGSGRRAPGTPPSGREPQGTPGRAVPAQPAAVDAIKDVIERANRAQEDAIASGDPTVMRDTATTDYYQDLLQTNQGLQRGGVTSIHLESIEWGPITATGTMARATAFETWTTNFQDGTSDRSRDRNLYRLVQQDGSWKIQSDDHPDNAVPPIPRGTQI